MIRTLSQLRSLITTTGTIKIDVTKVHTYRNCVDFCNSKDYSFSNELIGLALKSEEFSTDLNANTGICTIS